MNTRFATAFAFAVLAIATLAGCASSSEYKYTEEPNGRVEASGSARSIGIPAGIAQGNHYRRSGPVYYGDYRGYGAGAGRGYGYNPYSSAVYMVYTPPNGHVPGISQWTNPVPVRQSNGEVVWTCWPGQRNLPVGPGGRCEDIQH